MKRRSTIILHGSTTQKTALNIIIYLWLQHTVYSLSFICGLGCRRRSMPQLQISCASTYWFRGVYCLHHEGNEYAPRKVSWKYRNRSIRWLFARLFHEFITLMMEAVRTSKVGLLQQDYMVLYTRRLSSPRRKVRATLVTVRTVLTLNIKSFAAIDPSAAMLVIYLWSIVMPKLSVDIPAYEQE
jgi:hypothetical protein